MTETDFLMRLGRRIRSIRTEKKLTQNQLALECDFEKASLSRIESGRSNPTMRTLLKISRALNTDIADFFRD